MSQSAATKLARVRRQVTIIGGIGGLLLATALLLARPLERDLWRPIAALGLVLVVAAAVIRTVNAFREIDVRLDASRRWVTLRNVHPEFAAAVRAARTDRRSYAAGD